MGGMVARAVALNHVSVPARDLEESVAFYVDLLGLERLPTPTFGVPSAWLRVGDREVHVYVHGGVPGPEFIHHVAFEVDGFMELYDRVSRLGIREPGMLAPVTELPDGAVQLYVRDPAGNLVELVCRDAAEVDRTRIPEYRVHADEVPQPASAAGGTLFPGAPGVSAGRTGP
jgi:lactoylglutathione lyase